MGGSVGRSGTTADSITWALEQARRDLIDLTRRNRLLHAPLEGRRPWCLALSGQTADDLFAKLYRQENFRGYAFDARKDEADEQKSLTISSSEQTDVAPQASPTRRFRLQTRLAHDKLQKRLAKIFREERTLEEEQGLSTLYLALGFLKWFDSEQSSEESFAPLLLVPVTMARVGGSDGYLLRGRDDDIVANISLREKLKSNFDINLPEIPDDDDWKPSTYFEKVSREIRRQSRWRVEPESVGLGFFTFSKFLMWRDLHPGSWSNNTLLDHSLVNMLLGQGTEFESFPPLVPDDEPIDRRIDISKCTHVVDADSSQAIVIEEARGGRNLVVQGPPGTGKSQTITNVIASAVHSGKTVLFVAEKTAALEVVYDRLRKTGLETICLEIHSRKANKRTVIKSLEQALRFSGGSQPDASIAEKLAARRDKLNQWASALHKPIGQSGRTGFDVIGWQVKLRSEGVRLLETSLDEAAGWTENKLSSVEIAVDRAAAAVTKLVVTPRDHVWFGANIETQSPFDLDRFAPILTACIDKFESLESECQRVIAAIDQDAVASIATGLAAVRALRHVAAVPKQSRQILNNSIWARDLTKIKSAVDEAERLAVSISEVEKHFRLEAWASDTENLLLALRADGGSFFRRMSGRYRKANAESRGICRNKPPKSLKERIALIELLQKGQESRRQFSNKFSLLATALGDLWAEHKTHWAEARAIAAWAWVAQFELGGSRLLTFAARTKDLGVYSAFADKLEVEIKSAQSAFGAIQKIARPSIPTIFEAQSYEAAELKRLSNKLKDWRDNLHLINEWVVARNAVIHLRSEGLDCIADGLVAGSISSQEARSVTELLIAESLWRRAIQESPELSSIDGDMRSECVFEFRDFDQQRIRAARQEVLANYLAKRPNGHVGAMGVIRAEINKKRGHRPIRRLMSDAGSAIQQLKPIFLMSPLSVAQFLPPGRITFDLLVIDEASQVAPEDALGVVARAQQIMVVGDDKQLPPTNFFKIVNAGDDYDEEDSLDIPRQDRASNFESILTLARTRGMSERMLAWHYRSKHPSLIALSNEECYAGRLLLPPSPLLQTSEFGLSLVQTPRGHYDRGGTRCDLVQAEEVARAIANHIRNYPNKSLGVACLSVQQRDAVDDLIDRIGMRTEVEAFTPKDERLFVKNLEAVQGDERDVIFISVGYGVAPNQTKPFLNFGPVSHEGGERRLNVLASRAREKCVVFSSINAADIPVDAEVRGTRMLRALLDFAQTGKLSAGSLKGDGFESPFEESVAQIIREAGFHVHPQVGVKGFRIDLGVIDPPRPGEFILGVECDGAAYHSARSARDRDRLRQQVLEGLGWRLHRIWSTDWFRNPRREADRLLAAIKEAKESAVGPKAEVISDEDLADSGEVDTDDVDATSVPSALGNVVEPDLSSNVVHYKECVLTVPFRRGLLDIPVVELSRFALEVVEAEGPVHTYEIARRIREAFRLQKTGKRILAHVKSSLQHLSRKGLVTRDGEFWSSIGQSISVPRNRRTAVLPLRRASMIAPAEYQIALVAIITEAVTISGEDLVVETARLFGFDRTGPDLKEAIDRQVERLVKEGRLRLDEDNLQLSDNGALSH
jgi:very-short-patch-repair endonuclease